jgi:hypothetical protein
VLATVLLPAVRDAYEEFLHHSDPLAGAPTHRFLHLALTEKHQQIETARGWADRELARRPADRSGAEAWTAAFLEGLSALGGVGTERVPIDVRHPPLPGAVPTRCRESPHATSTTTSPDSTGQITSIQPTLTARAIASSFARHQPLERGLGGRDGRHYSQLLRLRLAVGMD